MKKYAKSGLSFVLVPLVLVLLLVPASAAGGGYTGEVTGFWDHFFYNNAISGSDYNLDLGFFELNGSFQSFAQWVNGGLSGLVGHGSVCSVSPDARHHASGLVDNSPHYDKNGNLYAIARCSYCGTNFNVYGSDLQQSYESQVAELPATGYNSAGHLIWQPTFSDLVSGYTGNSQFYSSSSNSWFNSFQPMSSGNGVYRVNTWSNNYSGEKVYFDFKAPFPGSYFSAGSLACEYFVQNASGMSASGSRYYNKQIIYIVGSSLSIYHFNDNDFGPSKGYGVSFYPGFSDGNYSNTKWYFPVFEVIPNEVVSGDTYNINSRPTSITGDYGIIGDNGQIVKVEGDKIVNETNNSYYNPATGETHTLSDWSYNYSDRSYTVTTETGDTVTITYGDENVTIIEGGDTYNIYYLVDGSGSENPGPSSGPDVPTVCNHQWTVTSTTPATCTVPGSRLLTCSLCGQTKTETIPAPGHTWTIRQTVNTEYDDEGNKIQEGYTIFECTVCGEQYKSTDGGAPPGSNTGPVSGSSTGIFSGIFGLLVDFLGFFWNTFRDFVGEGVKGFLSALMDGTSSIFGLLNPFSWGG